MVVDQHSRDASLGCKNNAEAASRGSDFHGRCSTVGTSTHFRDLAGMCNDDDDDDDDVSMGKSGLSVNNLLINPVVLEVGNSLRTGLLFESFADNIRVL